MGLNASLALEVLQVAAARPEGIALSAEAAAAEEYHELRRIFDVLVHGGFLVRTGTERCVLSQRGDALIDSLRQQVVRDEERKKKLRTLVLDVLGF